MFTTCAALCSVPTNPGCQTRLRRRYWFKTVRCCYLSEAYLTRDRQSQRESRCLEVQSHASGEGAAHKQYTTSVEGGTNFPPVRFTAARAYHKLREARRTKTTETSQ